MLRRAAAAVLATSLLAAPAFGQALDTEKYPPEEITAAAEAIGAAGITEETYQQFWCALAFTMFTEFLTDQGETQQAQEATVFAATLFDKVSTAFDGLGLTDEQTAALPGHMRVIVVSQDDPEFSQQECTDAARVP